MSKYSKPIEMPLWLFSNAKINKRKKSKRLYHILNKKQRKKLNLLLNRNVSNKKKKSKSKD
jgi:hypothetical protein